MDQHYVPPLFAYVFKNIGHTIDVSCVRLTTSEIPLRYREPDALFTLQNIVAVTGNAAPGDVPAPSSKPGADFPIRADSIFWCEVGRKLSSLVPGDSPQAELG